MDEYAQKKSKKLENTVRTAMVILVILISGCLEIEAVRIEKINTKYDVIDYTINVATNDVDVVYIEDSIIKSINFHMSTDFKNITNYHKEGVVVIDNETYLKKEYVVTRTSEISPLADASTEWYSLHIEKSPGQKKIIVGG